MRLDMVQRRLVALSRQVLWRFREVGPERRLAQGMNRVELEGQKRLQ